MIDDDDSGYEVRPYRLDDRAAVVQLLQDSLGGGPSGEWSEEDFEWKHERNPFGRSLMLVCENRDQLVGLRAFMRWAFDVGGTRLRAVRAVDTATHPGYQGRGIFTRITRAALKRLEGETDLVFNTPNEKSGPGYLKMGWEPVGSLRPKIRVRRPLRAAAALLTPNLVGHTDVSVGSPAEHPAEVIGRDPTLEVLLAHAERDSYRLQTPKDLAYVLWRYVDTPVEYSLVRHAESRTLKGLALFRMRERRGLAEATVTDLFVERGDVKTARRLLAGIIRSVSADHLMCLFAPGSTAAIAARRTGFIAGPRGAQLVVNRLRPTIGPDPTRLASWGLSLGDLELF